MSREILETDRLFVEAKYQELLQRKGILILKPMNSQRRKIIERIVREYPDMISFTIGDDENKQIVLRYKPVEMERIDIENTIKMGNEAFKERKYTTCLRCFLLLIQIGKPRAFVYAKLGLTYLKMQKINLAIEYLTIATYMSKQTDGKFDYTELIENLKNPIPEEDKKAIVYMKEKEFKNDTINTYGINIEEITEYILANDLDVESACEELGIDDVNVVRLIYARKYYSQGDFSKGDEFIKVTERNKNKSTLAKKLLNEIRTKKKFYFNRDDESQKLVLSLKPKK